MQKQKPVSSSLGVSLGFLVTLGESLNAHVHSVCHLPHTQVMILIYLSLRDFVRISYQAGWLSNNKIRKNREPMSQRFLLVRGGLFL